MNGGVQNRLLAAFPPTHINQVVCCELVPEERGDRDSCGRSKDPIARLSGGTVACKWLCVEGQLTDFWCLENVDYIKGALEFLESFYPSLGKTNFLQIADYFFFIIIIAI